MCSAKKTINDIDSASDNSSSEYSSSDNSSSEYSSSDNSSSECSSSDSDSSICNDEINELENETDYDYEYVVGIDLGTSNSCVAIYRNNQVEIIPDEYGNKIIPSYVAYTQNGTRYVGNDAKNQTELNPKNVFYETKRLIGRKITDSIIENEKEFRTYSIGEDNKKGIILLSTLSNINNETNIMEVKKFTPEEIASSILSKLKNMASKYLGTDITKVVITIPANFNDGQRQATKDAAKIAGLECIRLVNEPTAAGIAYGMTLRTSDSKRLSLVYDFGGGTLDITLIEIENGRYSVIASSGNMRLGGSDFDTRLIQYSIGRFEKINHLPKIKNIPPLSMQKLKISCEDAKKKLSSFTKTYIVVHKFYNDIDLCICLKRIDIENLFTDLLLLSMKYIDDILKECDYSESDIDDIILVGGMTRMPKIRSLIKLKFGKDPICNINPDEAIAAGAAIDAYIASHRRDPFTKNIKIQDVITLSLGVEVNGGLMDHIIHRNDSIPCSSKKRYNPDQDFVDSVTIKIYEGERALTQGHNFFVGEFELSGLEKLPRLCNEIEVKFSVDINGIISVSAENLKTNDCEEIIVSSNKNRLTEKEIQKFIEESKELEMKDLEIRNKKMAYFEINESCSNILINILPCEGNNLSVNNRTKIEEEIKSILLWLKEKKFDEREYKEYEEITEKIRDRYGVLMLKGASGDQQFKENEDKNTTRIYGDDDDISQITEVHNKMAEELVEQLRLDDPEIQELNELKDSITNLCSEISKIISDNNLNMDKNHITELKEYIDDSLFWLYVHKENKKDDYIQKLNDINDTCNKFMDIYLNKDSNIFIENPIIVANTDKRIELENLSIMLKLLISKNELPGFIQNIDIKIKELELELNKKNNTDKTKKNSNNILTKNKLYGDRLKIIKNKLDSANTLKKINNELISYIDESLKFIFVNEYKKINDKNFDYNSYHKECEVYINNINNVCNQLNDFVTDINIDENIIKSTDNKIGDSKNIIVSEVDKLEGPVFDKFTDNMGTSIIDIKRDQQKSILYDMINKNNIEDIEQNEEEQN